MGGIVCAIPWRATVRFDEFPEHPTHQNLKEIEAQMREVFKVPSIYEQVFANGHGEELCNLLGQPNLSETDLRRVYEIGEAAYE